MPLSDCWGRIKLGLPITVKKNFFLPMASSELIFEIVIRGLSGFISRAIVSMFTIMALGLHQPKYARLGCDEMDITLAMWDTHLPRVLLQTRTGCQRCIEFLHSRNPDISFAECANLIPFSSIIVLVYDPSFIPCLLAMCTIRVICNFRL